MSKRFYTMPDNPRTALTKIKMPKWIWRLHFPGFTIQHKKYLNFLWRQRPGGCNWSREIRGKFFNRSIRTIQRYDEFLEKNHFVWVTGKSTLFHRIGARPYYSKDVWLMKKFSKKPQKPVIPNVLPYTAKQV